MFLEHDDFYTASGHTFFQVTKAVIEAPGETRENHYVISELAKRLGAKHRGFDMTPWEIMDETLKVSGMWDAETNWAKGGQDYHLGFETSHFLDGFAWPDKKFRFKPDWEAYGPRGKEMPKLPDHFDVIDNATAEKPFRLVAAPARTFLNSTFTETPSSQKREVRPTAMMNPDDCKALGSPTAIALKSATSAARRSSTQKPRPASRRASSSSRASGPIGTSRPASASMP
jgi:anaerobic selenocysteine-containing dehydrogenase